MVVSCVLLGGSAAVRAWQDQRLGDLAMRDLDCPFPLGSLPRTLGNWRALPGGDQSLDPLTLQIAGGADHIIRTYYDELTGVSLMVLVIYGPADHIAPHTPEVCYPAFGFRLVTPPSDHRVAGSEVPIAYRASVYQKGDGPGIGPARLEEVCWSLRGRDGWAPEVVEGRPLDRSPAMFKVQVQRLIGEFERRDLASPSEDFLAQLLPEIDRTLARAEAEGAAPDLEEAATSRPAASASLMPATSTPPTTTTTKKAGIK